MGNISHKVGFIGLGNVGAKLAGSLLRNKIDLTVRDLDKAAAQPLLDAGAEAKLVPALAARERDGEVRRVATELPASGLPGVHGVAHTSIGHVCSIPNKYTTYALVNLCSSALVTQ